MARYHILAVIYCATTVVTTGCATKQLFNRPAATCPQPSERERLEMEQSYREAQKHILNKYPKNGSIGRFVQVPCSLDDSEDSAECQEYQQELKTIDRKYACHIDPTKCSCANKVMHSLGTTVCVPFALAFDIITSPIQLIIWMTFRNWHWPSI
jgi:hypothetical protein